jgi:histidinol-phosphate aminotransferase
VIPLDATSVHGGVDLLECSRLGLAPEGLLDFSVNTNPFGPSPLVRAMLRETPIDAYPDRHCVGLRRALADFLDVAPTNILPGNGASELIWLTALTFVRPGERAIVVGPAFGEYARALRLASGSIIECNAREYDGFAAPCTEIDTLLATTSPRIVFLCHPNNPTGSPLPCGAVKFWARRHPGTCFVVDESYLPFAKELQSNLDVQQPNLVVLCSMTKDHALAGLRLGYAVSHESIVARLAQAQPPWSVNSMAQAAGVAALADQRHLAQSLMQLGAAKSEFVAALTRAGLTPLSSAAHFFLLNVKAAATVREELLLRGLLTRDGGSFGLPAYLRIATRLPEENMRLVRALREVLA